VVGEQLEAVQRVEAGQRIDFALGSSTEAPADLPLLGHLDELERFTRNFWQEWAGACMYAGPHRSMVLRSALTLKLLSYAPSGAIIAAPTTSLPELIGGTRNWDYRYCWLRDAGFTLRALLRMGNEQEGRAFADWLIDATRLTRPELQVAYTLNGESRLPERTADWLTGYRDSQPVRIGNAAANQFQLDCYGEVADALVLYYRSGGTFDHDAHGMISGMARVMAERWREPDFGIWEVRSGLAQHIHSKIMAWLGLVRCLELAQCHPRLHSIQRYAPVRDEIFQWIMEHGVDPARGCFTATPGGHLDASLLVIPLVGFLPGRDPRVTATIDAVQQRLANRELVYRYHGPDGLPGGEGAFVICSFWLVEALARAGRVGEAHAHFQRLLERCNDVGLLAEEIDPATGEQLGNFPQALSHIGLINAALTLAECDR
jgi:GH15 family glucan-1,4-alpha-glucosidase